MHDSSEDTDNSPRDRWEPVLVDIDVSDGEAEALLGLFASEHAEIARHPEPYVPPPPATPRALLAATPAATPSCDASALEAAETVTRVSLTDLFASGVSMQWCEMIAVAQGVCDAMLQTSRATGPGAPPLWHVLTTSLGTVEIAAGIVTEVSPVSLVVQILKAGLA